MDTKKDGYRTNYKYVTVKLTDGTILYGKVNIHPNKRVSDAFVGADKTFVILVESDSAERSYQTVVVNKKEVVWAEPEDDDLNGVTVL